MGQDVSVQGGDGGGAPQTGAFAYYDPPQPAFGPNSANNKEAAAAAAAKQRAPTQTGKLIEGAAAAMGSWFGGSGQVNEAPRARSASVSLTRGLSRARPLRAAAAAVSRARPSMCKTNPKA